MKRHRCRKAVAEEHGIDRATLVLSSVVILGAIMSILDVTIVNVAIDTLSRDFRTSLSTIQWVTTGYLLALSTVIPLSGWAMSRFGAKRVWIAAVALFVAGSAACGLSWSIESLITFRVLQGLGGGMIMPVSQAVLAEAAGPHRMGRVMSIIGVPMLLGPVVGPVLGGWIVQDFSWRWIFFVNVPIGAVALTLAARILPRVDPDRALHLDIRGLLLLSPGLALFVYGLSEAGSSGGFRDTRAMLGISIGAVLVALFIWHGLARGRTALLDLRLFRHRSFAAATATAFLFGIALFGSMILLPLYYQVVRGEGALNAGLLLAPQGLGAAMAMPIAGRLTDRLGAGRIVPFGITFALLGTIAYAQIGADTPYWLLSVSLWVRGIGLGSTMMPAMAAAYAALARSDVPRASTTLNIIQRVGGSVGTAVLAVYLAQQIRGAAPGAGGSAGMGNLGAIPPAVRAQLAGPLADAFGQAFWLSLGLTAVAYIPAFFLPRKPSTAFAEEETGSEGSREQGDESGEAARERAAVSSETAEDTAESAARRP